MNDKTQKDEDNLGSFYMGRSRIEPEEGSKRKLPSGLLTFIVLLTFAAIIWYAYPQGEEKYKDIDVPIVKADLSEIKEIPTKPSGMEVPHQDSALFDSMDKESSKRIENILPSDEEPIDKEAVFDNNSFKEPPRTVPVPQFKPIIKEVKHKAVLLKPKKRKIVKIKKIKRMPMVKKDTYVQLGSYREKSDVEKDWIRIKKKYAKILSGLKMKSFRVNLKAKGVFYRLHAGKVSKDKAVTICESIKALRGGCLIVKK